MAPLAHLSPRFAIFTTYTILTIQIGDMDSLTKAHQPRRLSVFFWTPRIMPFCSEWNPLAPFPLPEFRDKGSATIGPNSWHLPKMQFLYPELLSWCYSLSSIFALNLSPWWPHSRVMSHRRAWPASWQPSILYQFQRIESLRLWCISVINGGFFIACNFDWRRPGLESLPITVKIRCKYNQCCAENELL